MSDLVTYRAVLPISRATVTYVAELLHRAQQMRGTRRGRRRLSPFKQAVLFLRWLLDAARIRCLAVDNAIGLKTAYRYIHEALDVLAVQAPSLRGALLAARTAGHSHVMIDGTLIATDRVSVKGPTAGVDLWWSGKHFHHGGNIQVVTAPDGWPIWVSGVRPGREHDVTCARTHPGLLAELEQFRDENHAVLADLGYEGEREKLTCPIKREKGRRLTDDQRCVNTAHAATRAVAERGNALLKTFKALRHVTICPQRIGAVVAAALVILHREGHRTT